MRGVIGRVGRLVGRVGRKISRLWHPVFECPVCRYRGAFDAVSPATGRRQHAQCPNCKALERHRQQFLILEQLLPGLPCAQMRMIHFAPEKFFRQYFADRFGRYETADLFMDGVDHKVDITKLPFETESVDFVFASHVLEHIRDDAAALSEIRRILKPGGIAVLPVPLVAERTVEYPEPCPAESYHVRAPGPDYYDRYNNYFSRVEIHRSGAFPEKYQLFAYEDRTRFPTAECPWRPAMPGERHDCSVPVCYR